MVGIQSTFDAFLSINSFCLSFIIVFFKTIYLYHHLSLFILSITSFHYHFPIIVCIKKDLKI